MRVQPVLGVVVPSVFLGGALLLPTWSDAAPTERVEVVAVRSPDGVSREGVIVGQVTDIDGEPLAGVQVKADGQEVFTGREGWYRLAGLSAGPHLLRFERDGIIPRSVSFDARPVRPAPGSALPRVRSSSWIRLLPMTT